jgi:hypothetical protein
MVPCINNIKKEVKRHRQVAGASEEEVVSPALVVLRILQYLQFS